LVGRFHRHATEIGHKVSAVSVTCKIALYVKQLVYTKQNMHPRDMLTRASLGIFAPKGQQITTVATPVGGDVREAFETMGDAVVDFLFVRIGLVVGLADTLGDNLGIALFVTGVLAIRTLHACGILEEFSTKRTAHNVVELLRDELVTLLLVDLFLLLAHGTLTVKTDVKGTTVLQLFGCPKLVYKNDLADETLLTEAHLELNPSNGFQSKP
jgi:hypothetical protein